jgi:hypothetical protein
MANPSAKSQPARNAIAVTPSDTVDIASGGRTIETRALFIGVAGNISVEMAGADDQPEKTVTFTGVLAGQVLPIAITRVNSTGTTATNMVALW